jgi:hypothetical protein
MDHPNELATGDPQGMPVQDVRFTIFEDDDSEHVFAPGIEKIDNTQDGLQDHLVSAIPHLISDNAIVSKSDHHDHPVTIEKNIKQQGWFS